MARQRQQRGCRRLGQFSDDGRDDDDDLGEQPALGIGEEGGPSLEMVPQRALACVLPDQRGRAAQRRPPDGGVSVGHAVERRVEQCDEQFVRERAGLLGVGVEHETDEREKVRAESGVAEQSAGHDGENLLEAEEDDVGDLFGGGGGRVGDVGGVDEVLGAEVNEELHGAENVAVVLLLVESVFEATVAAPVRGAHCPRGAVPRAVVPKQIRAGPEERRAVVGAEHSDKVLRVVPKERQQRLADREVVGIEAHEAGEVGQERRENLGYAVRFGDLGGPGDAVRQRHAQGGRVARADVVRGERVAAVRGGRT